MTEAVVRAMRPEDVDEALEVFASVAAEGRWLGTEGTFDKIERRASWLADLGEPSSRSFVVVTADGRLLGNGRLSLEDYGVAELGMALAASARGRGLGGALLDVLVDEACTLGAHKVELQVWPHNEPALRLYLSRGFTVEGRLRAHYPRANGELWDAVIMGRSLEPRDGSARPGCPLPDAPALRAWLDVPCDRRAEGPSAGR